MFPEQLRRFTLLVATVAAFGIAEQSRHPSPVLARLPGAAWPGERWSIWVIWNVIAAVCCFVAFFTWPKPAWMRFAAVVFASGIVARSTALWAEYGTDLWGTISRNLLTALLVVGSWSWSPKMLRKIEELRD